ncbi:MAG: RagB/SusD family nutrient uptake outer membrane protein [Bacteroidota bacterium]
MHRKNILILTLVLLVSGLLGCKKYLDEKPQLSLATPSTLKDLQAVLDDILRQNRLSNELIEIGCDDYYATTTGFFSSTQSDLLSYLWDPNAGTNDNFSWDHSYSVIYSDNVVLDALPKIVYDPKDSAQFNSIKGSALFYRAFQFYELAQVYCLPYADNTKSGLGIVLRTKPDIETKSVRATLQETYEKIIADLKIAADLVPITTLYPTRPNKAAVYGMLARVYLSMNDYVNAGNYANQCLQLYSTLMNYNNLTQGAIPHFNTETIYYNMTTASSFIYNGSIGKVDSTLYSSYAANDMRKTIFYKDNGDNTYRFVGSYDADYYNQGIFDGICTDEMYLIRAESAARSGNKDAAIADLNTLLQTRWKTGTFTPFIAATAADALKTVLTERRKELTRRGLRWTDIRRLNAIGANITLTRIINGTTYTLPPGDLRWAYLISQYVIDHSEILQNPR